ncbi:MAG: hypothetical protein GC191_09565 [Azospirillum sp.]|nr:hypothetical protein [Azospirillum sp.]
MDNAIAAVDWVTAHLGTITVVAFAAIGVLSQAAARLDLAWLARASSIAHDVVQGVAGNWGHAANAVLLIQLYRAKGPDAALAELARLAASTPADGGGSPPGTAPAALLLAVGIAATAACAPLTERIDQATGTTIAERCAAYRTGAYVGKSLAGLFGELDAFAEVGAGAVEALCAGQLDP